MRRIACTIHYPDALIAIGFTSGLGSIACSILQVSDQKFWICSVCSATDGADTVKQHGPFCDECGHEKNDLDGEYDSETLWHEVLSGPRKKRGVSHHRRYNAHRLMFEIFFDRWPPAVIALGPPGSRNEPLEWIVFMRTAIFELGKGVGVPVLCYEDDASIARVLAPEEPRTGLKILIQRRLPDFGSNKRRTILSTASAMAGAVKISR